MDKKTLDRLLSLLRNPLSDADFSDSEKQFVDELHRSILGSPVRECSCRNRYADAYYEIMATLPKETRKLAKMVKSRKYRLIAGYLIYHDGDHYSNVNLTDEVAEAYLKKHPDAAKMFEIAEEAPKENEVDSDKEETEQKTSEKKSKK